MVNCLNDVAPQLSVDETEPDIRNYTCPAFATSATRSAFIGIPSLPILLLAFVTAAPAVSALTPTKTQLVRNLAERHHLVARQAVAAAEATCACVAESAHAAGAGFAVRGKWIPVTLASEY